MPTNFHNTEFTKEMRKTRTIYMPDMLHYHNDLLCAAFAYGGYRLKIVPEYKKLTHYAYSTVNKEYCTCAFFIVGQLLTFMEDPNTDPTRIAFLEPQAGGACRAGNYYNLIIECLRKSGYSGIPVLSLNAHGLEKHSGFSINAKMLFAAIAAVCYSDLLMTLTQQIKPYEVHAGETAALREKWLKRLSGDISHGRHLHRRGAIYREIIADFKKIETDRTRKKKRVGIVGEIYIKYSPIGNFHLEEFLEREGFDYRQGGFINYCIYVVYTEMKSLELQKTNPVILWGYRRVLDFLYQTQRGVNSILCDNGFLCDGSFKDLHDSAKDVLSEYYNIGDGWLITGEIADLIRQGYDRILVVHPFGCLVSHVGERGVLKKIHEIYPNAKVTSVEYDSEQTNALRESRILLAID